MRQRTPDAGGAQELRLSGSHCSTDFFTVVLNRLHVQRALTLGLCDVHPTDAQTPVIFRDERRTYVTTTLDIQAAVPELRSAPAALARIPAAICERPAARPTAEDKTPTAVRALEEDNVLSEVEGLRGAVGDVVRRAARLVLSLRQFRKHRRILENAWTVLKNLRPGP